MTHNRIKELRKNKGLSQSQLANKVGISNQVISFYEKNKREPKIETWQALANFFDVSVPYLQGIDDKPNTGYSKEYIYKCLDDAYKEKWKDPTGQIMGSTFDRTVDTYLKLNKIKKPSKISLDFWRDNFSFIFDNFNINRLLTTKDKYSDNDIKLILETVIFLNFPQMKQIIEDWNNSHAD